MRKWCELVWAAAVTRGELCDFWCEMLYKCLPDDESFIALPPPLRPKLTDWGYVSHWSKSSGYTILWVGRTIIRYYVKAMRRVQCIFNAKDLRLW